MRNDVFMEYKNILKFEDGNNIYKCFKLFDRDK